MKRMARSFTLVLPIALIALPGCQTDRREEPSVTDAGLTAGLGETSTTDATSASPSEDELTTGIRLDVGSDCATDGCDVECQPLMPTPCDSGTSDPFAAMELSCIPGAVVTSSSSAHPTGIAVVPRFGHSSLWTPRRGEAFAVIGSGHANGFGLEHGPDLQNPCENTDGTAQPLPALPEPLQAVDVAGDCLEQPDLVGTGDCSNTLAAQFQQGFGIYDYSELRVEAKVPETHAAIAFDFAFVSEEYPEYVGSQYNDMFVAWLESERWTGNVSFDDAGNPISINAAFMDQTTHPPFEGTCWDPCTGDSPLPGCESALSAGGTKWLTSTAPVEPGETITLVFAIWDASDSALSSFALIDNVHWTCDGSEGPSTVPVG